MTTGTDHIVLEDCQGRPLYILEGDEVRPHPQHPHSFGRFGRRCTICHKTRKQITEESK